MRYTKLIFKFFQGGLIVVVICVVALLILGHFGYVETVKPFVVQSGSMEPSVPTASIVFTLPQSSYQQGDIITFHPNGNEKQTVTHRVEFKLYPDGINEAPLFMTAGDANKDVDKWDVRQEHIIGKTVLTVPFLGYLVDFAKKPEGFILLVIVPATIVIYEELKNLFLEIFKGSKKLKTRYFKGGSLKGGFQPNRASSPEGRTISKNRFSPPKTWILFPLFGVIIFMVSFSAGYFSDLEKAIGNMMRASDSFPQNMTLENKRVNSDWSVIEDDTFGNLKYVPVSPTFNYEFKGQGLVSDKKYCLIYYADPWPGDGMSHSTGFLIDEGTADVSGNVYIQGSKDIGTDLPNIDDENLTKYGRAKIWLIPCSNYNTAEHKVSPWAPNESDWLFEVQFVNYTKTTISPTPESPTPTTSPSGGDSTITFSSLGATSQYGPTLDYSISNVTFTYTSPSEGKLSGTINGSSMKTFVTYQVKFEGKPTCQYADGNDTANEYIGYLGRWTCISCTGDALSKNRTDSQYEANKAKDPIDTTKECIAGYLVWDDFTADSTGNVTKSISTDNSYHVLYCGGGSCNSNNNDFLENKDGSIDPPGYPYCSDSNVNGMLERPSTVPCDGLNLNEGIYNLKIVLTEESFHQSSFGTWATVLGSDINFEID